MSANKQTEARFRLSTTVSTAIALQSLLARTTDLNSELLALRGKLDIFIANIQMGAIIPSYIPKTAITTNSETGVQESSLFHRLMNDPATIPEIKNKLFAYTIQHGSEPDNKACENIVAAVHGSNISEESI